MRNKISAPVPWRESINGWTDTLRAAGLSAQTIKSRRYKMVHLATLLMPSGPEDVTTEQIVQAFARQQWKPETRKAYRNTISSFFRWLHKSGRRSDDPSLDVPRVKKPHAHPRPCPDRYIAAAMEKATSSEKLMIRLGAECGLRRGEIARVNDDGTSEFGPNRAIYATRAMEERGYLSQIDYRHVPAEGELYTILHGQIVALGFEPDSGASVSLTEEQAETVTEYFTETSPAGSGLLENLRLRLGLPSFAADPTDTSDPTGIATSSDVVTPSMKGL